MCIRDSVSGLRVSEAVHRAVVLDTGAEAREGGGTARIETGHDVVVVVGVAGHRLDPCLLYTSRCV